MHSYVTEPGTPRVRYATEYIVTTRHGRCYELEQ